ncbi:MAG: hypothetical protein V2I74_13325 [Erythrobacter sp.]|nr:hypothetical protein [Erythrobacter sp.]
MAETEPLIADDPADPRNRRISLLLLDAKAGGRAVTRRPAPVSPPNPGNVPQDKGQAEENVD